MTNFDHNSSDGDSGDPLKRVDLFKSLDDTARGEVARLITWRLYTKDTEIIPHMGQGERVKLDRANLSRCSASHKLGI